MEHDKFQSDQLEERLIDFAARIIGFSAHLPRSPAGRHRASQILRSGTSPAADAAQVDGRWDGALDFTRHALKIEQDLPGQIASYADCPSNPS
jgi:hypothetical protein